MVWVGVDNLALNLVGPAGVVVEGTNAHADIDLGHGDSLAVVESLNGCEEVEVLLEKVCELVEELSTVLWGLTSPWAVECFAGSGDGDVYILLGGLGYGADHLFGGWVDGLESASVNASNPLVVDEAMRSQLR